jgi:Tfp pilus assembly protein PilE
MSKGFTAIELLLVFVLAATIAGVAIPVSIQFLQIQTLDETTAGILSTLRRAHNQSIFQKNDSAFGVKFLTNSYILFEGSSYVSRDQSKDEPFNLPSNAILGGSNEITFSKLSGIPPASSIVTISLEDNIQTIDINDLGKIERQ